LSLFFLFGASLALLTVSPAQVCHRPQCAARSALPIGRELLPDDYRRLSVPFGFSDR